MNWENLPSTNTPINATNLTKITDSGSNTNGHYIKFQDGTLIQWGAYDTGHKAFTTAYGSIYYDDVTHTVSFPISFVGDRPSVSLTAYLPGGLGGASLRSEPSATSCNCYVYSVSSYTFTTNVKIIWTAIGRWKA